ncbi:MAG TPA: pyruvate dehydrogenase [Armatimonadetes bacterium]|jgi:2-oxoisovalerate dehydrogenase E1 component|nr:pyruvate dehydrogenase [Armatimonadota bacterium]
MPKDFDVLPSFQRGTIEIPPIPQFVFDRDLESELAAGLTAADAITLYDHMLHVRLFEETIVQLKSGRYKPIPDFRFIGATHLSIGQEAIAVGAMAAINPDDYITSTHRGHGHSIAKVALALETASTEQLLGFLGDSASKYEIDEASRESIHTAAMQEHLFRTFAELFGKEEGYCRGRGGGMHIADFHFGHLGANAIVGGSYAMAAGAAMAASKLKDGKVCLSLVGDGATNNGIAHEAYNFATMAQFEDGCPVIYLIENNQYGMTGQQVGEVTGTLRLARRGAGYNDVNMHAEVVNGMDPLAVRDAVRRAAEKCRNGEGPVLLECLTYRFKGHSLSDNCEAYRSDTEECAWMDVDPLKTFPEALIAAGVLDQAGVEQRQAAAQARIEQAAVAAAAGTDPDPSTIYEGLLADSTSENIGDEWKTPEGELLSEPSKARRDGQGRILVRHAVAEALMEEMLRDRRVVVYGEDVADYGGAFGATRGLIDLFGRQRVFNTAISEAAICGTAAGASMAGLRPVAEIMYIDFVLMAMDQIGNQAAKNRYMFGGKATLPMVIRTSVGGGKGYAGQHSQSLEAVVTMFPGLKVVAPSSGYDLKGLLKSAIRDDNPVIFIEHQHVYTSKDAVPEEEYTIPLGEGKIWREGSDITVVAYSHMRLVAEEAAAMAEEQGISVELIDPRTLIPLDEKMIADSVRKTGHLLIVQQAPATGCFGEHIAFKVQEACFEALKRPVRIVAAYDVPPPMAAPLEEENIPSPEKVLRNIKEVLGK